MNTNTDLLDALLAEKTPEEIADLRFKGAAAALANYLHTLLCPATHGKDCDFYIEEETTVRSKAKEQWQRRTRLLLAEAGIREADEVYLVTKEIYNFLLQTSSISTFRLLKIILPSLILAEEGRQAAQPALPDASQSGPAGSAESPEQ